MPTPTPTLDPNANSLGWCFFTLGGWTSPGTIPRSGIKGFARETGWDEKKGKGTQGATLTLKDMPPCKGSITIQIFTPQDFLDWDAFVLNVLSINVKTQQATGLSIYHPSFSSIGLTTVVIKHYTPPDHVGKGMYHAEIHFIEWQQPGATSIVATVDTTKPDSDPTTPPQVDPRVAALQAQIEQLNKAAQAP